MQFLIVWVHNEISGAVLGGAIAGIVSGALGGYLYGLRSAPFVSPELLGWGSTFGAMLLALGILFYDYSGDWSRIGRASMIAIFFTIFPALLLIVAVYVLKIDVRFFSDRMTLVSGIEGGAALGLLVGVGLGLQVGLSLWFYRRWNALAEPITR